LAIIFIVSQTKKESKEIKIGAILPLAGPGAKYGENLKQGIDLAVEEINNAGGIKGSTIRIVYEDEGMGRPTEAVAAARKLINVDKIPVIIGAMGSSNSLAIAPIAEENRVILFSPASSAPKLTEAGDYIFRNTVSDIFDGQQMAQFAWNTLGVKTVAILYVNNDYGVGVRDAFKKKIEAFGGKVISVDAYEQDATDFRAQLFKVKQVKPETIYLVGYQEMILILRQAKELGIDAQILSTVMFEDPEILAKVGDAAEGVIYTGRAYDPTSEGKEVKEFLKAFKLKYGKEPDMHFAANGYDAVKILEIAIERGGYTSEGIKNALYKIKDFPGVSGLTTFDENGDVIKPFRMRMVKDGRFVNYNPK
jgi:branched-chain amino acid transport system substrate-binding protein